MQSPCAEHTPSRADVLARRLGFAGPITEVPSTRRERWAGEGLARLAHGGDRQGVELLLGWPAQPGPASLRRWVARLARRAPLRRFLHLTFGPDGVLLLGMMPPGRFEPGQAVVRELDDETWAALERVEARGREHLTLRLTDVLGREALTQRFFRAFRTHLCALETAWRGLPPSRDEGALRRDLSMTTLCRLMFVTFLARAGRLGPIATPRWIVEHPRERSLYRTVLRPLFFGALNTPLGERSEAVAGFAGVPFLNGGLFQPLDCEVGTALDASDPPLLAAIDELLEGYDFTAREGDVRRAVPAIDPAMLGQVFEALMHVEERRGSGSFYTPPRLVTSVVRDLLAGWAEGISSRCGVWVNERLAGRKGPGLETTDARALHQGLAGLRALDPAVGSGAFLLGVLEALVTLRAELATRLGEPVTRYALTREIITHSLYGVDRKVGAVRLCELRLWLALAVEAPNGQPLEPLPNLDHRIRQGDSLSGPGWSRGDGAARFDGPGPAERDYAELHGAAKAGAVGRRRAHEKERLAAILRAERARLEAALGELWKVGTACDLFGERRALQGRPLREAQRIEARLGELAVAARDLRRGELPFFSYRAAFPEVAARGGFDLVVGNPPWVRLRDVPKTERERLRRRFRFARGLGSGFHAQVDLSVLFVERALELAAPGGLVGLLLPAKLFRARYGRRLRATLTRDHSLLHYADLSLQRSRLFSASNYPAWLLLRHGCLAVGHTARTTVVAPEGSWHTTSQPPDQLPDGGPSGPWLPQPLEVRAAFERMREGRVTLSEYGLEPALGLKTGCNRVFLTSAWTALPEGRLGLEMADGTRLEVEADQAPEACHGRDLGPFSVRPGQRLLAAYDREQGRPRGSLGAELAAYFERHSAALRRRRDAGVGAAPWRLFRTRALRPGPKVIWRDLAPRLEAVFRPAEAGEAVPLNTAYWLAPADAHEGWVLAALLNSRCVRLFTAATAEPAMSGYLRFMAWNVGRIPWPSRLRLGSRTAVQLAELSEAAHAGWTAELQAALDERVAWAYGLDPPSLRALEGLLAFYPAVAT